MQLRLIEAALAVFAEKGIEATVIDDVISAAGVARGGVGSKQCRGAAQLPGIFLQAILVMPTFLAVARISATTS